MGIDIPHTLAILKGVYDAALVARSAEKEWNAAEWKFKLAEVAEATFQARMTIVDLQEQLRERDDRIATLERDALQRAEMVFAEPFYWRVVDGRRDGPFCQRCLDAESKVVRVQRGMNSGHWQCKACSTAYRWLDLPT